MNGTPVFYVNQYGDSTWAKSARELQRKYRGRLFKIYRDKKDGSVVHVGYGVGQLWFNAFVPFERAVS